METENSLEFGRGRKGNLLLNGYRVLFGMMKNFWKQRAVALWP